MRHTPWVATLVVALIAAACNEPGSTSPPIGLPDVGTDATSDGRDDAADAAVDVPSDASTDALPDAQLDAAPDAPPDVPLGDAPAPDVPVSDVPTDQPGADAPISDIADTSDLSDDGDSEVIESCLTPGVSVGAGSLTLGGKPLVFDDVSLSQEHKVDVDPAEGGCLTEIDLRLTIGGQCELRLSAWDRYVWQGGLVVESATLTADSFCPGFTDAEEGTYTLDDLEAHILPSPTTVEQGAELSSCWQGDLAINFLGGSLSKPGNSLAVTPATLTVSGAVTSAGSTSASCPCQPDCSTAQCGSDGCGDSCGVCDQAPDNATPLCDAGQCGFSCDFGFHDCDGVCADDDDVNSCGDSCVSCPTPPNSTPTCDGTTCGFQCNVGFQLCDGACVPLDDPSNCGPGCVQCPVPAGGAAECVVGFCQTVCPAGEGLCGDFTCQPTSSLHYTLGLDDPEAIDVLDNDDVLVVDSGGFVSASLLRIAPDGTTLWDNTVSNYSPAFPRATVDVYDHASDGVIVLSGRFSQFGSQPAVLLLTSDGQELQYPSFYSGDAGEWQYGVALSGGQGVLVHKAFGFTAVAAQWANGSQLPAWQQLLQDESYGGAGTSDGGAVYAGARIVLSSNEAQLLKVSAAGSPVWVEDTGVSGELRDVDVAADGYLNTCLLRPNGDASVHWATPEGSWQAGPASPLVSGVTHCSIESHPTDPFEALMWTEDAVYVVDLGSAQWKTSITVAELPTDAEIRQARYFSNGDIAILQGDTLRRLSPQLQSCDACGNDFCDPFETGDSCPSDCF